MTWLRAIFHTMKVLLIFVICTLSFYFGLIWISEEYKNYQRYEEPEGKAIKVHKLEAMEEFPSRFLDRFILFYKLGE